MKCNLEILFNKYLWTISNVLCILPHFWTLMQILWKELWLLPGMWPNHIGSFVTNIWWCDITLSGPHGQNSAIKSWWRVEAMTSITGLSHSTETARNYRMAHNNGVPNSRLSTSLAFTRHHWPLPLFRPSVMETSLALNYFTFYIRILGSRKYLIPTKRFQLTRELLIASYETNSLKPFSYLEEQQCIS